MRRGARGSRISRCKSSTSLSMRAFIHAAGFGKHRRREQAYPRPSSAPRARLEERPERAPVHKEKSDAGAMTGRGAGRTGGAAAARRARAGAARRRICWPIEVKAGGGEPRRPAAAARTLSAAAGRERAPRDPSIRGRFEAAPGAAGSGPGRGRSFAPGDRVMALLGGGGYAERAHGCRRRRLWLSRIIFRSSKAAAIPEVFLTAWMNLFLPPAGCSAGRGLRGARGGQRRGHGGAAALPGRRRGGVGDGLGGEAGVAGAVRGDPPARARRGAHAARRGGDERGRARRRSNPRPRRREQATLEANVATLGLQGRLVCRRHPRRRARHAESGRAAAAALDRVRASRRCAPERRGEGAPLRRFLREGARRDSRAASCARWWPGPSRSRRRPRRTRCWRATRWWGSSSSRWRAEGGSAPSCNRWVACASAPGPAAAR